MAAPAVLRAASAEDAQSVTIAFPVDVESWDPLNAGTSITLSIYKMVFGTLLDFTPDSRVVPGFGAFKWLDDQNKVLELTLSDGITFHNGDPLTADDIHYSIMTRLKQDDRLTMAANFGRIVTAMDTPAPNKVVFHFAQKYILAPQRMSSNGYVVPRKYYEAVGPTGFLQKPIGAGPYKLVDYARDSRIVLEAHDRYWRGAPKIRKITIQIMRDTSARIAAVQSGQVDFAHNLPVREVARLGALPGLVGDLHPISNVVMIHMVNRGVFKDKNLRLAMHHAINKEALSRAFFNGKAQALSTWAGKGAPAYDPDFKFPHDPELARSLLAAAGYSMSNPARIDFLTFNGVFPNDFDIARALVQMWKQVGIEANLQTIEFTKYGELSRNDRLEAPVLYNWFNPTDDPESYSGSLLHPGRRFSVWKSDDVMPRLDPLLNETNYEKRVAGYKEFDRWTVEQGYALPILQGVATVVHTKRVNYVPHRSGLVSPYAWTLSP